MITLIGVAAGEIWEYLDARNKKESIKDLMKSLGKDRDIMMMSIGWLAREGHIVLEGEGPDYEVRLKD